MPIIILGCLIIFIFRREFINLVFTSEFMGMAELFKWQLVGDVFRAGSWICSFYLLAKAKIKIFTALEIIFAILFLIISELFMNLYGLIGVTFAYACINIMYLIIVALFVKKELDKNNENNATNNIL